MYDIVKGWYVNEQGEKVKIPGALGRYAGYDITTGCNNIALGFNAGRAITTGSNNIAIGTDVYNGERISTGMRRYLQTWETRL